MDEHKVYDDLVKAQAEFKSVVFDKINPRFKSGYATLAAIREAILPALHKYGFFVSQPWEAKENGDVELITELIHKSGVKVRLASSVICKNGKNEQEFAACFTYQRRYQIASGLFLFAEADDDGNGEPAGGPSPIVADKKAAPLEDTRISQTQLKVILGLIGDNKELMDKILHLANIKTIEELKANRFNDLLIYIEKVTKAGRT